MGGKSGSDTTVGYKYFLGVHMALAHGPLDNVNRIDVDRRIAWEGVNDGESAIVVDAPNLFGGDGREGGVSGNVDIDMGGPAQLQNDYLLSVLGNELPAFRGVACAVLNQVYTGNNPYIKPWAFRAQRIFVTTNGASQWYLEKAAIGDCVDVYSCSSFGDFLTNTEDLQLRGLWPLYSAYAAGGGPVNYNSKTPALIGDDAWIGTGTASTFELFDIIDESCYDAAWLTDAIGGGFTQPGMVVQETNTNNESIGILYNWQAGTGGILVYLATGGTFARVTFTPNTISGDIELSFEGVDYPTNPGIETTTWASIGKNLTDTHWYHLDVTITRIDWTGQPGGQPWALQVDARALIDGEIVLSGTYWKRGSVINLPTGADLGWNNTSFLEGYHNWAYWGPALTFPGELDRYTEAYERNFITYTPTGEDCDCADMNPAHIIYECLTDTAWGMGYASSDIDDAAFMASADTLFDESFGLSLLWHKQAPLEEFVSDVLRHVDGVLYVDRKTGKFVFNLVRDDYQNDTALIVLNEDNVAGVSNAKRPTTGELTSSITVNYWDRETGETGSVTEHNWPLIQIQGAQTHTTIQYPGVTNQLLAQRLALRDLGTLSTPLLSCRIEAGREATELNVGDAFILDWPDLDVDFLVMRVQQMTLGDNRDNTVVIEAVEDSFSLPVARDGQEDGGWQNPIDGEVRNAVPRIFVESPYYEIVRNQGELTANDIINNNNDAGFILTAAGRQGNERNADLWVDSGSGYTKSVLVDFAPYAYLIDPITETDKQVYIRDGADLDLVSFPSIAQIGNELVRVDAIETDSIGQYVLLGRGILDTVPAPHGLDSNTLDSNHTNLSDAIIFWDEDAATDYVEYTASETVSRKLPTSNGSNTQSLDDVPGESVTFNSRAFRPYPPGLLQIDGEAYPEANTSSEIYYEGNHTISWAYRDRLQQTDGNLYDYTFGNIGPEAGTTYRVDIYSTLQNGGTTEPWYTVDAGQTTSYEMDSAPPDTSRSDPPAGTELVHIRVTALRDGYESWQSPVATLSYQSDSAGGSGRITEGGAFRTLESGASRTLEDGT